MRDSVADAAGCAAGMARSRATRCDDGVPLQAWFIPADSNKLLIVNHPMTCNRYGFPGHLPPRNTMFGGFEVNFLPELNPATQNHL
jgi:hypothetical protein